jgi:hypothetical protein
MSVPRCPAPRRDGRVCGTLAASPSSRFCTRHEALAEKWGEERVLSGDYPGNVPRKRRAMTVERLEPEAITPSLADANGDGSAADPAGIRPALAQLAASNLDALQRALLDAALSATTTRWATVACGECGARSRVELPVPDVRSRLQAIETLLSQGLGRPGQAEEPSVPRLPRSVDAVGQMGWEEMQYVFATSFVNEIAAVQREGGDALLRDRLGELSEGERRVLREALRESELV